jgi:hypothetical protein
VSWDNSHYYILPVFLRTLFDNKKVINSLTGNFSAATDLRYAAQQLVYNVMQNHTQVSARQYPVFANYMDGTDGWSGITGPIQATRRVLLAIRTPPTRHKILTGPGLAYPLLGRPYLAGVSLRPSVAT